MNVNCPKCGAANHEAADVCSLCGRMLKETPTQDKSAPKARKFLTPSLIVAGGIVFGMVIAMANNMRGWELALGMLITTGCAILIAAAVFVAERQPVRQRSGRRRGYPRRPPTPPCERFRTRRFSLSVPIEVVSG